MSVFSKKKTSKSVSLTSPVVMPPQFYDEINVVNTFKNTLTGPPPFAIEHGEVNWYFNNNIGTKGASQWTVDDYNLTGVPMVEWAMEMASKPVTKYSNAAGAALMVNVPGDTMTWKGAAIPGFPALRDTNFRAARWGRQMARADGKGYSCPLTLTVKIGSSHYTIPDLWFQTYMTNAINSNWKKYETLNLNASNATGIECYAYENGDIKKPVVVHIWITMQGTLALTNIEVVRSINTNIDSVTAFQDEFNWRMAVMRFNAAVKSAKYDPDGHADGYLGWVGLTAPVVSTFLNSEHSMGALADPIMDLGVQNVTCLVKDVYVVSVDNANVSTDYASTWTLQNDLDLNQSLKSNDWAYQMTDTHTFTWGMSEQVAVKITVKWEFEMSESIVFEQAKMKYAFQFEAGYTHTFTESWTDTHTETKTITMGFQSIVVPPKSAVHLNAVLSKVDATGVLGQAVQIVDDPVVKVAVLSGTPQIVNDYYNAVIDLASAATVLRMTSITPSYTPKQGKAIKGAFAKPTLHFAAKAGAQGTLLVTQAPYVPAEPAQVTFVQAADATKGVTP